MFPQALGIFYIPTIIPVFYTSPLAFNETVLTTISCRLRAKVWNYASFESRNVKLFPSEMDQCNFSRRVPKQAHMPALLHTSQEARPEGLRYYKLCWDIHPKWVKTLLYINFDVGRFRLSLWWRADAQALDYNFNPEVLKQIQSMEIEHVCSGICYKSPKFKEFTGLLSHITNLKEVAVLLYGWNRYDTSIGSKSLALISSTSADAGDT